MACVQDHVCARRAAPCHHQAARASDRSGSSGPGGHRRGARRYPRHDLLSRGRHGLAAGMSCERGGAAGMAGVAATRAIDLAKLARRFPALLVADAQAVAPTLLAQMIVVQADALTHANDKILDTLEIVSEARIPLPD